MAWLEFLAGEALDSEHQAPLASSDGVWADTRRRLDAAAAARGFAGREAGERGRAGGPLAACWACVAAGVRWVSAAVVHASPAGSALCRACCAAPVLIVLNPAAAPLPLPLPAVALVTELDPDAPTRQHKALQADDAKDEQRLAARLFRLLRAGALRDGGGAAAGAACGRGGGRGAGVEVAANTAALPDAGARGGSSGIG